jgi:hypothetical protein
MERQNHTCSVAGQPTQTADQSYSIQDVYETNPRVRPHRSVLYAKEKTHEAGDASIWMMHAHVQITGSP